MDGRHLFADSFFGSVSIALDKKEKMRTKEMNAREDRSFERWTKILQRGKESCEKNTTWEKYKVYQTLRAIWERTPRLEKSLAAEKARVESLQMTLLARINPGITSKTATGDTAPFVYLNSPQAHRVTNTREQGDRRRERQRRTDWKQRRETEKPLNTDLPLHRHHEQGDFVRRNQHVVTSLVRLHRQRERRRRDQEKLREELVKLSKPVIYKARVVLRGYPHFDSDLYLDELESYLRHSDIYKISEDQDSSPHTTSTFTDVGSDIVDSTNVRQLGECPDFDIVLSPVVEHSNGDKSESEDAIFTTEVVDDNNNNTYVVTKDKDGAGNYKHSPSIVGNRENVGELDIFKGRMSLTHRRMEQLTPASIRFANRHVPLPGVRVTKSVPRLTLADAEGIHLLGGSNKDNASLDCRKNMLTFRSRRCLPSIARQDGSISRSDVSGTEGQGTTNSNSSSFNSIPTFNTSSKFIINGSNKQPETSNKEAETSNSSNIFIDNKKKDENNDNKISGISEKSTSSAAVGNNRSSKIEFKSGNIRGSYRNKKIIIFKNSRASNAHKEDDVNNALINSDTNNIDANIALIKSDTNNIDTNIALKNSDTNDINNIIINSALKNDCNNSVFGYRDTSSKNHGTNSALEYNDTNNSLKNINPNNTLNPIKSNNTITDVTRKSNNTITDTTRKSNNALVNSHRNSNNIITHITRKSNDTITDIARKSNNTITDITRKSNNTITNITRKSNNTITDITRKSTNAPVDITRKSNHAPKDIPSKSNNALTDITRKSTSITSTSNPTFNEKTNNLTFAFTPSASVSQVILEEDEMATPSPTHRQRTSSQKHHSQRERQ